MTMLARQTADSEDLGGKWSLLRSNQVLDQLETSFGYLVGQGVIRGARVSVSGFTATVEADDTVFYCGGVALTLGSDAVCGTALGPSATNYLWGKITRTGADMMEPTEEDSYALSLSRTVDDPTPPSADHFCLAAIVTNGVTATSITDPDDKYVHMGPNRGRRTINLSGNLTLSAAQWRDSTLKFTGGAHNVTFPPEKGSRWLITNSTSGNITAKLASSTGVTIPTGYSCWVECDGAELYQVTPFTNSSGVIPPSALPPASTKDPVRVATTGNITLSGEQTIDGVAVVADDRVLVKDQSTGSQNGVYVASAGAWTRATDADTSAEVVAGMLVPVEEGDDNADTLWILTTNNPITLGTTALVFELYAGDGGVIDLSPYVKHDGSVPFTGEQSMGNHKLTNVTDPTSAQDAATKAYVDAVASGLDWKPSVRAATTAALPSYNHSGGVLTATANGALAAQDGVTLTAGQELLVKNETGANEKYNGIYTVTQVGSGGTPWILTRRSDANTSAEVTAGLAVFVSEGTLWGNTTWVLTTNDAITLGTTALTFTQFGGSNADEKVKVSSDDTTPGYLENKIDTENEEDLLLTTTSPAGNEKRRIALRTHQDTIPLDSILTVPAGGWAIYEIYWGERGGFQRHRTVHLVIDQNPWETLVTELVGKNDGEDMGVRCRFLIEVLTGADPGDYGDEEQIEGTLEIDGHGWVEGSDPEAEAVVTLLKDSEGGGGGGGGGTPPDAPSGLSLSTGILEGSTANCTAEWTDNSDDENGFQVWYSFNGTDFHLRDIVGAGVTEHTEFLAVNTHVWVKVRAYNAAGYSAFSNTADIEVSG